MSSEKSSDFTNIPKTKPRSIVLGLVIHSLAWCLVLASLAFAVPKFERVSVDYGVDLPSSSRVTIKASRFLIGFAFVLVPLAILLLVVDGLVMAALARIKGVGLSRAWFVLGLVPPLLAISFILAATLIPLVNLSHKFS